MKYPLPCKDCISFTVCMQYENILKINCSILFKYLIDIFKQNKVSIKSSNNSLFLSFDTTELLTLYKNNIVSVYQPSGKKVTIIQNWLITNYGVNHNVYF